MIVNLHVHCTWIGILTQWLLITCWLLIIQSKKEIVSSFTQCHSTKFPEDADLCFLFSFKESLPLLFSHFQAQVHVITSIAHIKCSYVRCEWNSSCIHLAQWCGLGLIPTWLPYEDLQCSFLSLLAHIVSFWILQCSWRRNC